MKSKVNAIDKILVCSPKLLRKRKALWLIQLDNGVNRFDKSLEDDNLDSRQNDNDFFTAAVNIRDFNLRQYGSPRSTAYQVDNIMIRILLKLRFCLLL